MSDENLSQADDVVVVRPGGQGFPINLVMLAIGAFTDLKLRIAPDGLSIGGFTGRQEFSWDQVGPFHAQRLPPGPTPYEGNVLFIDKASGSEVQRNLPLHHTHFGLERLVTLLNVYRLEYLLKRKSLSDDQIVDTVVRVTGESNWHCLWRSFHLWTILGLVGRHRPELVPNCIHMQAVSPVSKLIEEVQSEGKAFESLAELAKSKMYESTLCCDCAAWTNAYWNNIRPAADRAMALDRADRLAERGENGKERTYFAADRCKDRRTGVAVVGGRPVDPDRLISSECTLGDAIEQLQLGDAEWSVFSARIFPDVGQGLIWLGPEDASVWLWVDKRSLKKNMSRSWQAADFMAARLAGFEFHQPRTHVTRWRDDAKKWSERVLF